MSNRSAFLALIRHAEGTDKAPDPYAVCFGGKFTITDFSDHPAVLGTWKGEPLDFLGPQYAGMYSTAAGAYQVIKRTWEACKKELHLPDFSPNSQSAAAILLITQAGAIQLVDAGRIVDAIGKCSGIWASLPGSNSGQPQADIAALLQAYSQAAGAFV